MEEHDPRESLKQSLIEMKLIRDGKLPKKTWDELYNELKDDELVQYFIVNSELNMSPGKIAAQVAHVATIMAVRLSSSQANMSRNEELSRKSENFLDWFDDGNGNQPKIILRGKQKELEKLIGQGWYYIRDNGRTEIPEGSLTVVGFAPEWKSIMKPILKRFQLL